MKDNFKIGTRVSHKTKKYLKNGVIHSFTKYGLAFVNWSDKDGILFRVHKTESLNILKN